MDVRLEQEVRLLHERICQGIGDPKRLFLLYELHRQPQRVGDLALTMGMPQPTVSRHLKVLRERSLVSGMREGAAVTYSVADPRIIEALDLMRGVLRSILDRESEIGRFTALGVSGSRKGKR
jgi:ArsR family transcriptional regulator